MNSADEAPQPPGGPPYVVACDFDGTITLQDVTNLIWDRHLAYDWRSVLLPPSVAGEITALEMIQRGYAGVQQPPEALLAELRPQVRLRDGFGEFFDSCVNRNWPFQVLSYGLRVYLRAFLPEGVPVAAFEGSYVDGHWQVDPPQGVPPQGRGDFKIALVQALRPRHPNHTLVYIGDGRLDFPAARLSDRVFAVRDSTLARMCRAAGVSCIEFSGFDEVMAALT